MRGLLITLEGIDGSGKSTVSRLLARNLSQALPSRRLVFTAEPTNGETGHILRARLSQTSDWNEEVSKAKRMEELFLFMADHADHLSKIVIPSLQEGAIVISDRYADSTAAYQGVTLRGIVPDPVEWIQSLCRPWNVLPDLTIVFALDPALALRRIESRASAEKFERAEFLRDVDGNFRRLAEKEPKRFVLIDAGRKIEDVAKEALSLILGKVELSV
ncbi:MAG TPA: dTMP kinase [Methanotrichaceae archaeon]|nr:dTMP kinase [Methanotrichaceae archaeon]